MKKLFILISFVFIALGSDYGEFDIIVQVHYLDFQVLDIGFDEYENWNPDTMAFDTTVYMESDEIIVLNNQSNVDVSVSASTTDRPDGYFDASYAQWDAVAAATDTNSYILKCWIDDTIPIDTISSEYNVLLEEPALILPYFAIEDMKYMLFAISSPKATTDYYPHEIIVKFEVSIF